MLHAAGKGGKPRMIVWLFHKGLNINTTNRFNETPIFHAVESGRYEAVIPFIMKKGIKLDV